MSVTSPLIQHFNKKPEYDQVIIINGDGLKDSVKKQNEFFLKHFTNVQILGDGKEHITIEDIRNFFDSLNTVPKTISDNALLVIHHHGNVYQFEGDAHQSHLLANGEKQSYHIGLVFNLIKKPIDIILASCHSGAAINDIDKLPSGSRLLTLSDENHSLLGLTYKATFKISATQQFSLKSFYYSALLASPSYDRFSYPLLAVSGESDHINFIQDDISRTANITQEQKTFLASELYGYICSNISQASCNNRVNQYTNKLVNITHINEIHQNLITQEHTDFMNNALGTAQKGPTANSRRTLDTSEKILEHYNISLTLNLEKLFNDTEEGSDTTSITKEELCGALEEYSDNICDHYRSEFGTSLAIIAGLNEYHAINS